MRILLDTHILIWLLTDDERLPEKARKMLSDNSSMSYYSPISIWESEIKFRLHPNDFPFSGESLALASRKSGLIEFAFKTEQIFLLPTLNYSESAPRPHKDPFDRLLLAQAKSGGLKFMTHDSLIPFYNEPCVLPV